ncbi:hypothetical protein [Mycolicibacterium aichiense]|uniref:Uncharacterized protein n=1 Tax=Mycolicibacterium aichiense TaxID=1799 RepID=A0AAD1HRV7_9MYCO|nr:hypothetical protein [Mycolicibacterium aichiense]MCV7016392.1 hypothetical protein [Mycolicibacterium aichiense]BBX09834.1 hypothetical protein MAIC_46370 [Mycolicibacterium aichiense]SUA14396.1 Uncharacterised protein [Mycolicibacterium aichiense]
MTTAAANKFSSLSTKLQVGTAAVAVAAAAAITPAVAHAAPSLAPFSENVGGAASLLVDPVVIVPGAPGSNKTAAANATPAPVIIQTFIGGFVDAAQSAILAGAQYLGTWVYGGLAFTGLVFNTFGLTQIGDQFDAAAWAVAKAVKIGPYSTSS